MSGLRTLCVSNGAPKKLSLAALASILLYLFFVLLLEDLATKLLKIPHIRKFFSLFTPKGGKIPPFYIILIRSHPQTLHIHSIPNHPITNPHLLSPQGRPSFPRGRHLLSPPTHTSTPTHSISGSITHIYKNTNPSNSRRYACAPEQSVLFGELV